MIEIKIIKETINHDSDQKCLPGDIVNVSEFEAGRMMLEKTGVPWIADRKERTIEKPQEKRTKNRKRYSS